MARLFISFITKQYFYAFFPIKKLVCFKIITNFVRVKTVKLHNNEKIFIINCFCARNSVFC